MIVFLPVSGIIVTSGLEERDRELATASNKALLLVQGLAAQQEQIAVATKQMLCTLAQLPEVRSLNTEACDELFRELNDRDPFYSSIVAATIDGKLIVASIPFTRGSVNVADRWHVREAIRTRDFSAGEYVVGRVSNTPSLNYSYPIFDKNWNLVGTISAGFKLDEYSHFIEAANLPGNSSLTITDHAGVRVYRIPENPATVPGKPVPGDTLRKISGDLEQGTFERTGEDGILRIYAFKQLRLRKDLPPYLYMIAGLPKDKIFGQANAAMMRNLSFLGIVAILALVLAYFFGYFTFVKPISRLAAETLRFGEAEMGTRTGPHLTPNELGQLTKSFDDMASAIEAGEEDRKLAAESLKQSNARVCHLNDVLRAIRDVGSLINKEKDPIELLNSVCKSLVQTRGYVMVWIGEPEADSKRVLTVAHSGGAWTLPQHAPITWDDSPTGQGPAGTAMRERRAVVFDDLATAPRFALWREPVMSYGCGSITSVPLICEESLFGVLTVKADRSHAFDLEEVELLSNLAADLARALQGLINEAARNRAEEALRESESQLRQIIDLVPHMIFVKDWNGKHLLANQAVADSYGISVSALTGRDQSDLQPDKGELQRMLRDDRAVISKGETKFIPEESFTDAQGNVRFLQTTKVPFLASGDRKAVLGIAIDITERKRAEEERTRLVKAVEQIAEGIMIADANFIIQYVNPAFEQITGYGRSEIIGQHTRILKSNKHDRAFYKGIRGILERGEVWSGRVQAMKKDGAVYEVEALTSPVRDESGTVTNYISIRRDITREVRLESDLRQAHKMEAIGTLAGGIAHDFNNLLTPIIGYAEMTLLNTPEPSPTKRRVEQILNAGLRAGDLVKQILAFSRFNPEQKMVPVEIGSVVMEALKLLRSTLPSTIEIRQSISSGVAVADATQIHQVLLNLCTNAAHAMDGKGFLDVGLSRVDLSESDPADQSIISPDPRHYLKLSVSDTGDGMDARTLERIFDPYFTTKEVGKGSGLGLAVVHGIVKRHGGSITVQSEPGQGTTFNIHIPEVEGGTGGAVETTQDLPTGTERILLIDDESIVVEMETAVLEKLGYKVIPVTDSLSALEIFHSGPGEFDLIITDYTMPKLTGIDVVEDIRRIRPDIPIILCTGFSEKVTLEGTEDLDVELVKPFSMKQIAESVRKAFRAEDS